MKTFQFLWQAFGVLASIFLLVVTVIGLGFQGELLREAKVVLLAVVAMLFGVAVGAAEVISRYRDEPFAVVVTVPAAAYLLLNGAISFSAFALLLRYGTRLFPPASGDLVLSAIAAGFGGMMIARSKLFTYQGESGNEYSFGPAIVLESFLKTLDRKIDRLRSAERQKLVFAKIKDIPEIDEKTLEFALDYLQTSLQSYQNLSEAEKASFGKVLEGYRTARLPPLLRMLAVGFALVNISGEENFDQVMADFVEAIKKVTTSPVPAAPVPPAPPPPAPVPPQTPPALEQDVQGFESQTSSSTGSDSSLPREDIPDRSSEKG